MVLPPDTRGARTEGGAATQAPAGGSHRFQGSGGREPDHRKRRHLVAAQERRRPLGAHAQRQDRPIQCGWSGGAQGGVQGHTADLVVDRAPRPVRFPCRRPQAQPPRRHHPGQPGDRPGGVDLSWRPRRRDPHRTGQAWADTRDQYLHRDDSRGHPRRRRQPPGGEQHKQPGAVEREDFPKRRQHRHSRGPAVRGRASGPRHRQG